MTVTRDPWSDANQAATGEVLDRDLAALRRRLWRRSALGLAVGAVALLAAYWLIDFVIDPDADDLWSLQARTLWVTFALGGLALVLMIVGALRSIGASRPFVEPDAFLPRTDRAWLRSQIAEGCPVADERHAVVADAARGMVAEGRKLPTYLGLVVLYVGIIASGARWGLLIMFSVLIVWMLVRVVRGGVWSRRARRWLAQNA